MKRRLGPARMLVGALVVVATSTLGCASDAAPEPEPELEVPGSFVAFDDGHAGGRLTLVQVLATVRLESGDSMVFAAVYAERTGTFAEARALAQRDDALLQSPMSILSGRVITTRRYDVVWYRSLTEEERERVP